MSQRFLNFRIVDHGCRSQTRRALEAEGFQVVVQARASGPVLAIRVREGTSDGEEAERIVKNIAPAAHLGPGSRPNHDLRGYRDAMP